MNGLSDVQRSHFHHILTTVILHNFTHIYNHNISSVKYKKGSFNHLFIMGQQINGLTVI